jgi:hypothetical protein
MWRLEWRSKGRIEGGQSDFTVEKIKLRCVVGS